ncbi:MAG: exodeoxyribonuclease V subunit gamma [Gammaproteobacteria bacterium]|nr:exodeoxyribonuclease V subunit gamma [Gammaproteobacteria bacterium]MBU1653866.1 exodeoxyribonuclease V subunit gamma [Gammaproteobacteria bacterium]MBU1962578.1 exodeoxyribonuclease V subunit gamma [Gammaproteobacteria bacterium]
MLEIHHSNRLEDLMERLAGLLDSPLSNPLAPEILVVQNQGMETWLSQQLALRRGIAANLEFPLPATFVWRMLAAQLENVPEENPFNAEQLLWVCLDLLPELVARTGFELPRRYLAGPDPERKAYQLAKRMADLFDQYLVYRQDWILQWETGAEDHWQAQLWRALVERLGTRHRARLLDEFLRLGDAGRLARDRLPERIALFGLTSQPPAYLAVWERLARATDIHLFVPNPSLAYWGDIESERTLARLRSHWERSGKPDVSAYYSVGNALLASLGKVGRDFNELLQGLGAEEKELFREPEGTRLLHRVQGDILNLRDRRATGQITPSPACDPSIQVHACHGPLREVQVLHDRLLECFEALPDLHPREVVVMAPNIGDYAPTIEAIFGSAPEPRFIPWSVADLGISASEPLAQAFLDLLALPSSRLAASEVLGLLELPALLRRFRLPEESLERVRDWIRKSGIRWGSDGQDRRELDLPEDEAHSWQFGLRRLLLGYALPERKETFAGYLPLPGIAGSETPWLGALHELIERLRHWRKRLAQPATAEGWRDRLNELLGDFFAPAEAERYLLQEIRDALGHFAEQAARANPHAQLGPSLVREHLAAELEQPARGRRFLAGQVTFCNLVPMRSIPFRVICLLGMNDGEFPRNRRPPSFDLMAAKPRSGDRSLREDDRYLFLEALLSARDLFYISYQGRDRRDNERQLPSMVVSELLDYLKDDQPLIAEHPLQPFSPACFTGSGPSASYAEEWIRPAPLPASPRFVPEPLPSQDLENLGLEELIAFFRHPAKYFLQRRLGLYPEEWKTAVEDKEPFTLDRLDAYHLRTENLSCLFDGRDASHALNLERAAGLLPAGALGELEFQDRWTESRDLAERITALTGGARGPMEFDLEIDGVRLKGRLRHLNSKGLLLYRPATLKAEQRIELWLRHLVLNALNPEGIDAISRCLALNDEAAYSPVTNASERLRPWIAAFREGMCSPLPFFPQLSLEFAERLAAGKDRDEALARAINGWTGNGHASGPGDDLYNQIAFTGHDPIGESFADLAERLLPPLLAQGEA